MPLDTHLLRVYTEAGVELLRAQTTANPPVGDEVEVHYVPYVVTRRRWHTSQIKDGDPARIGDQIDLWVKPIVP